MSNMDTMAEQKTPKTLIVLVPNHLGDPQYLQPIKELLREMPEFKNAYWHDFCYKEPWYSNKNPEVIARDLAAEIDNLYFKNKAELGDVVLAGHSMGTAILRRAYLDAKGFGEIGGSSQEWANHVKRIILMGAFGRGFDIKRLPGNMLLLVRPLLILSKLFGFGKMRRSIMIGADFIGNLRVDWIRFNNCKNISKPQVVHLLGTDDSYVKLEDIIDIEQFPEAIPVSVSKATHASVVSIDSPDSRIAIVRAFQGESVASRSVTPSGSDDVYFFMHGIRSSKSCFQEIASRVGKLYEADLTLKGKRTLKPIPSTYGFLSIRGFLNPSYRNSFVPWFIDYYAEELAKNPNAKFYYAGHSNGTYILGEALARIHGMKFERIYLAASVLPQDYDWEKVIEDNKQVLDKVRSDMGSKDWAVGILAKTLHSLGMQKIGSSGYDYFKYGSTNHLVENVIPGGHDAMLRMTKKSAVNGKPDKLDTGEIPDPPADSIAKFLVFGEPDALETQGVPDLPSILYKFGNVLLPLGVFVFVLLLLAVWHLPVFMPSLPIAQWGPLLALSIAIVVWIVLGRI